MDKVQNNNKKDIMNVTALKVNISKESQLSILNE